MGWISPENDGASPAAARSSEASNVSGRSTLVGSTAFSSRVMVASSDVDTRPATVMGPASKRDSLMSVVAVASRLPSSAMVAVPAKVALAVVSLTVTDPVRVSV